MAFALPAFGVGSIKKGIVDPLAPPKIGALGKPKLLQPDTQAAAEAQKLKALAAYGLSDTKKTGPKGLGSAPAGNKLYATLLGG